MTAGSLRLWLVVGVLWAPAAVEAQPASPRNEVPDGTAPASARPVDLGPIRSGNVRCAELSYDSVRPLAEASLDDGEIVIYTRDTFPEGRDVCVGVAPWARIEDRRPIAFQFSADEGVTAIAVPGPTIEEATVWHLFLSLLLGLGAVALLWRARPWCRIALGERLADGYRTGQRYSWRLMGDGEVGDEQLKIRWTADGANATASEPLVVIYEGLALLLVGELDLRPGMILVGERGCQAVLDADGARAFARGDLEPEIPEDAVVARARSAGFVGDHGVATRPRFPIARAALWGLAAFGVGQLLAVPLLLQMFGHSPRALGLAIDGHLHQVLGAFITIVTLVAITGVATWRRRGP